MRFIYAEDVPAGSVLNSTVCVVGAGAAGITLAVGLARMGIDVLLLEAGGEVITGDSQSLYAAPQTGLPYFDLTACRLRFLGGTTNHWGGYCRENDPIDYEARPDLGIEGWPVNYSDIRPYVVAAAKELGLDSADFHVQQALRHMPREENELVESKAPAFETKVFKMAKRLRFREEYKDYLESSERIQVVLRSNVVGIKLDASGRRVARINVKGYDGREFTVSAKAFVLAAHAIENARLLLAANDVAREGIGNDGGAVGKYFMEHPRVDSGIFFPTDNFPRVYNFDSLRRYGVNANLSLSRNEMMRHGILQYYCRFMPIYRFDEVEEALRKLRSGFFKAADSKFLQALARVAGRPLDLMQYAGYYAGMVYPSPIAYRLDHRIEQAPSRESAVVLLSERDAMGVPKVALNWRLSELDYKTFDTGQSIVRNNLARLGMGRFETVSLNAPHVDSRVKGHYHHIGTTRMGVSIRSSVVDRNCKVHDVANLFVAGSSVFPSSGYSGPTMMIVAFSMRLADYLGKGLARNDL